MPSRDECVSQAGRVLAQARADLAVLSPREQAEAAYTPSGPSVDEIEDRIRLRRGMTPIHDTKSA